MYCSIMWIVQGLWIELPRCYPSASFHAVTTRGYGMLHKHSIYFFISAGYCKTHYVLVACEFHHKCQQIQMNEYTMSQICLLNVTL